jgi:amino acid adenylation domain-containing protein
MVLLSARLGEQSEGRNMQSSIGLDSGLKVSSAARGTKTKSALCARISACAASDPHRQAINDGSSSLTYKQLDDRSNQLARLLVKLDVGSEDCVALLLERSGDFVISALAVLKAGGAYLPLDSSIPADRAAFILRDAGAQVLISHRNKAAGLAGFAGRVIELDGNDHGAIDSESTEAEAVDASNDQLAYVVYTSGSTGRPKGVEITHGNLQNLIAWHQEAFEVTADDRASQVAGLGFDAAGWEIWPHLAAGASVHIADEVTRRSPQRLRDWLVSQRITISFVPTVLVEQMLHLSWPADSALRVLLTGADTLRRRPVEGLPFIFVNNYGPTECTVVATSGVVLPDEADNGASHRTPSIGRPILNANVLILDGELRPVVPDEAGELCIGGALVGRGYRNNPEMTARRFVDYTADGKTMRIYRTGDQARWLPSGEIAFLGRVDDQVKIRGYRVELGEIVATLDRYPGVEASVVIVRDAQTNPVLAAYIVPAREAKLADADLRAFLAARLPDYMIPTWFIAIESLPLTANGKLDAAALPAPDPKNVLAKSAGGSKTASDNSAASSGAVNGNDLQDRIGAIVAELLGQPSVCTSDNFFMIGGHSMLGVQLVARIRDAFSVKLTLRQLFGSPTVSALAAEVEKLCAKVS